MANVILSVEQVRDDLLEERIQTGAELAEALRLEVGPKDLTELEVILAALKSGEAELVNDADLDAQPVMGEAELVENREAEFVQEGDLDNHPVIVWKLIQVIVTVEGHRMIATHRGGDGPVMRHPSAPFVAPAWRGVDLVDLARSLISSSFRRPVADLQDLFVIRIGGTMSTDLVVGIPGLKSRKLLTKVHVDLASRRETICGLGLPLLTPFVVAKASLKQLLHHEHQLNGRRWGVSRVQRTQDRQKRGAKHDLHDLERSHQASGESSGDENSRCVTLWAWQPPGSRATRGLEHADVRLEMLIPDAVQRLRTSLQDLGLPGDLKGSWLRCPTLKAGRFQLPLLFLLRFGVQRSPLEGAEDNGSESEQLLRAVLIEIFPLEKAEAVRAAADTMTRLVGKAAPRSFNHILTQSVLQCKSKADRSRFKSGDTSGKLGQLRQRRVHNAKDQRVMAINLRSVGVIVVQSTLPGMCWGKDCRVGEDTVQTLRSLVRDSYAVTRRWPQEVSFVHPDPVLNTLNNDPVPRLLRKLLGARGPVARFLEQQGAERIDFLVNIEPRRLIDKLRASDPLPKNIIVLLSWAAPGMKAGASPTDELVAAIEEVAQSIESVRNHADYKANPWLLSTRFVHGSLNSGNVLVGGLHHLHLVGFHESLGLSDRPLFDLTRLSAGILLEDFLLPVSASDFVEIMRETGADCETVAKWLNEDVKSAEEVIRHTTQKEGQLVSKGGSPKQAQPKVEETTSRAGPQDSDYTNRPSFYNKTYLVSHVVGSRSYAASLQEQAATFSELFASSFARAITEETSAGVTSALGQPPSELSGAFIRAWELQDIVVTLLVERTRAHPNLAKVSGTKTSPTPEKLITMVCLYAFMEVSVDIAMRASPWQRIWVLHHARLMARLFAQHVNEAERHASAPSFARTTSACGTPKRRQRTVKRAPSAIDSRLFQKKFERTSVMFAEGHRFFLSALDELLATASEVSMPLSLPVAEETLTDWVAATAGRGVDDSPLLTALAVARGARPMISWPCAMPGMQIYEAQLQRFAALIAAEKGEVHGASACGLRAAFSREIEDLVGSNASSQVAWVLRPAAVECQDLTTAYFGNIGHGMPVEFCFTYKGRAHGGSAVLQVGVEEVNIPTAEALRSFLSSEKDGSAARLMFGWVFMSHVDGLVLSGEGPRPDTLDELRKLTLPPTESGLKRRVSSLSLPGVLAFATYDVKVDVAPLFFTTDHGVRSPDPCEVVVDGLLLGFKKSHLVVPQHRWRSSIPFLDKTSGFNVNVRLIFELSHPICIVPIGSRMRIFRQGNPSLGTPATVEKYLRSRGVYELRLDNIPNVPDESLMLSGSHRRDGKDEEDFNSVATVPATIEFDPLIHNHEPAGIFRYAVGQHLLVFRDSAWVEVVVTRTGTVNRHTLEYMNTRGSTSVDMDLNEANHTPRWLDIVEFEARVRDYAWAVRLAYGFIADPVTGRSLDVLLQPVHVVQCGCIIGEESSSDTSSDENESDGFEYELANYEEVDGWKRLEDAIQDRSSWREFGLYAGRGTVVWGARGSGKTTLAQHIATLAAQTCCGTAESQDNIGAPGGLVPIVVSAAGLSELLCQGCVDPLDELVEEQGLEGPAHGYSTLFRQILYSKRASIIVDGAKATHDGFGALLKFLSRLVAAGHAVIVFVQLGQEGHRPDVPPSFAHLEIRPLTPTMQHAAAVARLGEAQAAHFERLRTAVGRMSGHPCVLSLLLSLTHEQMCASACEAADDNSSKDDSSNDGSSDSQSAPTLEESPSECSEDGTATESQKDATNASHACSSMLAERGSSPSIKEDHVFRANQVEEPTLARAFRDATDMALQRCLSWHVVESVGSVPFRFDHWAQILEVIALTCRSLRLEAVMMNDVGAILELVLPDACTVWALESGLLYDSRLPLVELRGEEGSIGAWVSLRCDALCDYFAARGYLNQVMRAGTFQAPPLAELLGDSSWWCVLEFLTGLIDASADAPPLVIDVTDSQGTLTPTGGAQLMRFLHRAWRRPVVQLLLGPDQLLRMCEEPWVDPQGDRRESMSDEMIVKPSFTGNLGKKVVGEHWLLRALLGVGRQAYAHFSICSTVLDVVGATILADALDPSLEGRARRAFAGRCPSWPCPMALQLRYLALKDCALGAEGLGEGLAAALATNRSLVSLDLSGNMLACCGTAHVVHILCGSRSMLHLNLSNNLIGFEGAATLAKALCSKSVLTDLCVTGNRFGDEGMASMASALWRDGSLQRLDLSRNFVTNRGAMELWLSDDFGTGSSVTELRLSGNDIGPQGVAHLASALHERSNKVRELCLENCRLGAEGAEHIANALQEPGVMLRRLELRGNRLGLGGAKALGAAFRCGVGRTLMRLGVASNGLNSAGAMALAQGLGATMRVVAKQQATNREVVKFSLEDLDVADNQIGVNGIIAIAAVVLLGLTVENGVHDRQDTTMMAVDVAMRRLDLASNCLGAAGAAAFVEMLQPGLLRHQRTSKVDRACWDAAVAAASCHSVVRMVTMARSKSKLEWLSLADNRIEDRGTLPMAALLSLGQFPELHTLEMQNNSIGHAGVQAMADALLKAPALHTLVLTGNFPREDLKPYLDNLCMAKRCLDQLPLRSNLEKAMAEADCMFMTKTNLESAAGSEPRRRLSSHATDVCTSGASDAS